MPSCPFCGAKLGRMESFVVKNKPLYKCLNCENVSEVGLKDSIYKVLLITQVTAILIFIASIFLGGGLFLLGLGLIITVFGLFYWVSPYMMTLKEAKTVKKKIKWYERFISNIKKSMKKENVKERKTEKSEEEKGEMKRELELKIKKEIEKEIMRGTKVEEEQGEKGESESKTKEETKEKEKDEKKDEFKDIFSN